MFCVTGIKYQCLKYYPLRKKLFLQLQNETASLHQSKRIKIANKIASISNMLQVAETEMAREVGERQIELGTKGNRQRLQVLENETKDLENQVEILLDHFSRSRLEEAKEKEKIVAESRAQRHNAYRYHHVRLCGQ